MMWAYRARKRFPHGNRDISTPDGNFTILVRIAFDAFEYLGTRRKPSLFGLGGRNEQDSSGLLDRCWCRHQLWRTTAVVEALPEEPLPPSALCVSTPFHRATSLGKIAMLRSLHERKFNPNARALIAGCQAFSPWQHAVRIGNLEACKALREFPSFDTATDASF
jgi:hypothetical protein